MKKKTLKSIGIQFGIAAALSIAVAFADGLHLSDDMSLIWHHLNNGFFIIAVLYVGVGSLMWISTTGFFDIFGYAVKFIAYRFSPSHRDERFTYYDYKCEQNDKRDAKPMTHTVLIAGLLVLACAFVSLMMYYCCLS